MELAWAPLEGRSGHDVGRDLLQKIVGNLPRIRTTDRGKPYFVDSQLHFSISHTDRHAFCAVSRQNIGIDAEEVGRTIDLRLAGRILSDTEKTRFQAAANPQDALLRLWVLKESYAKLTGRGWGNYLCATDFDPDDPRIQVIDGCYLAVMEEENAL